MSEYSSLLSPFVSLNRPLFGFSLKKINSEERKRVISMHVVKLFPNTNFQVLHSLHNLFSRKMLSCLIEHKKLVFVNC